MIALQRKFLQAEKLFNNPNPTDASDALAFDTYDSIIHSPQITAADALLVFRSYLRCGNLLDIKKKYAEARLNYQHALDLQQRNSALSDSLIFTACIYEASAWYNLNNFDSANALLLKAESLIVRYPGLPDKERMYNSLGAIYFESGNYQQSRNYFSKALETVRANPRHDRIMEINFASNIASSLFKLGMNRESLKIYREILQQQHVPSYLFLNMGKVQAAMGDYRGAITSFRQSNVVENPGVYNELGYAHFKNHNIDSAIWYLDKFQTIPNIRETHALDNGMNFLYHGEVLSQQLNYRDAIAYFQKGIIAFSGIFKETDRYRNPQGFAGSFNPYNLYFALFQKATAFEALFRRQSDENYLQASLNSYESALELLRYIERSYDTDDAKIFLKNKSQEVYEKALNIAIELHLLFPQKKYLDQAFLISEKNKASIIAAGLQTKKLVGLSDNDLQLLAAEQQVKNNLARLNIKADQLKDEVAIRANNTERMEAEMSLSRLQRKLEQNSAYFKAKYNDDYPTIPKIQEQLNDHQALINFKVAGNLLHVFVLTNSELQYVRIDSFSACSYNIAAWLTLLSRNTEGRKFTGQGKAAKLYDQLIRPIQSLLPEEKKEWVIIPDGILCYLPFESLPSGDGNKYLVETTEISYAFSARFLSSTSPVISGDASNAVLSFAPFASVQPIASRSLGALSFQQLPESKDEISGLKGNQYFDRDATKSAFIRNFAQYPVIHLATHAVSDPSSPAGSYIAFYPSGSSAMQNCLFLDEMYNLNMQGTKLIILSACESGNGQWVSNEGVISIARAFAYAGCQSTVQSMWKAEDKSTAYIMRRFHVHLHDGATKSAALQQAKIDYLNSDAIYKTPDFWAHLVLTGNTDPIYGTSEQRNFSWFLGSLIVIVLGYIGYKKVVRE